MMTNNSYLYFSNVETLNLQSGVDSDNISDYPLLHCEHIQSPKTFYYRSINQNQIIFNTFTNIKRSATNTIIDNVLRYVKMIAR
jgi:hypothetical protein